MIKILGLVAALIFVAPALAQPLPAGLDKPNAIVIDTTKGRIVFKLRDRHRAPACRAHQAACA